MIPQLHKKKIVDSIAKVAKQLGHTPSKAEFQSHSGISDYFVLQFFGT